MNTQATNTVADGATATAAAAHVVDKAAAKRKPRGVVKSKAFGMAKSGTYSKREQLVALLSKPHGAPILPIVDRLG